jgi:hypothetical protein
VVIGSIAGSVLFYNDHVEGKRADAAADVYYEAVAEHFDGKFPQALIRHATLIDMSKFKDNSTIYMDYEVINGGWYTVFLVLNNLDKTTGDKLDRRYDTNYSLVILDLQVKDCLDKSRNRVMNLGASFLHTYTDADGNELLTAYTDANVCDGLTELGYL